MWLGWRDRLPTTAGIRLQNGCQKVVEKNLPQELIRQAMARCFEEFIRVRCTVRKTNLRVSSSVGLQRGCLTVV